jgi:hypothetical protein
MATKEQQDAIKAAERRLAQQKVPQLDTSTQPQETATGSFNAAMIAAGREVSRLGSNIKELVAEMSGGDEQAEIERQKQLEMDFLTQRLSEDFPKSDFVGSMLPMFAVPGRLPVQVAAGATEGFLQGDTIPERLKGAALGAGLAFGGQKAGDLAGQRLTNYLARRQGSSASLAESTTRLAEEGVPVPVTQRPSMIPGLRRDPVAQLSNTIRGVMTGQRLPGFRPQVKRMNRLALEAIGETGDEIGLNSLGSAHTRIGSVFEDAANNIDQIRFDVSDAQRLSNVANDVANAETQGRAIRSYFDEVVDAVTGGQNISGKRYNQLRQKLGKASRAAWRQGDELAAETADELLEIVDDAMARTSPSTSEALRVAREQWRMLKVLRRARAISPEGDINPASIETAFRSLYPGAEVGKFPGNAAGRFGQSVNDLRGVAIPRQTSGTAENLMRVTGAGAIAGAPFAGLTMPMLIASGAIGGLGFSGGGAGAQIGGGLSRGLLPFLLQQSEQQQAGQ